MNPKDSVAALILIYSILVYCHHVDNSRIINMARVRKARFGSIAKFGRTAQYARKARFEIKARNETYLHIVVIRSMVLTPTIGKLSITYMGVS